jgi:hypothetical protein
MKLPTEALYCLAEDAEKDFPVGVVPENRLPGVAARSDVVAGTGIFDAKRPRHVLHNAQPPPRMTDRRQRMLQFKT